ncbi:MAG: GPR endopeptidase [Mollicutes bacterium]|nr:GPR endopeptidase [Mollicutes bacterium]
MGREIDLKNYKIRTDLAIEAIKNIKEEKKGIITRIIKYDDIKVTDVLVDEEGSKKIDKKVGNYITIEFEDITDYDNREKLIEVFSTELKKMMEKMQIKKDDLVLVVGLGNETSTPDALGPLSVKKIIVTNHLYLVGGLDEGFRRVCAISPGVMGETGMETSDLVVSVIEMLKPDLVIVIDALASQSVERLNKTIQMTDTGIHPGSGVGNQRKEISKEIIGIPVVAIGIPTVVDAVTIVSDTLEFMQKHFSYTKKNINNPINKLIPYGQVNYLNQKIEIEPDEKQKLLGMLGILTDDEIKQLISEILTPIGYNLMVTPKEIDFIMHKLSEVIGQGINQALHEKVQKR